MPEISLLLSPIDYRAVIDVIVVTVIVFWILRAVEGTRAIQLIRGVVILLVLSALLGSVFQLTTLGWLIRNSLPVLLIAIPVIFQPELRRALEQLGRTGDWLGRPLGAIPSHAVLGTIEEIVQACAQLARNHTGALIVIERRTGLQEYIDHSVPIDAAISARLIDSLFFPNSALHDGAIIIRNERIAAAGVLLPLSDTVLASPHFGTRHRAAIGISEQSDALAVVVSEETGTISIASNGKIVSNLTPDKLREILASLLQVRSRTRNHEFRREEATKY